MTDMICQRNVKSMLLFFFNMMGCVHMSGEDRAPILVFLLQSLPSYFGDRVSH